MRLLWHNFLIVSTLTYKEDVASHPRSEKLGAFWRRLVKHEDFSICLYDGFRNNRPAQGVRPEEGLLLDPIQEIF